MRYILLDQDAGIFLGTHRIPLGNNEYEGFVIFSLHNPFGITKAYSFDNLKDAELYMYAFLIEEFPDIRVFEIECQNKYVDVVDLLKNGLDEFTFDMIDNIPMINDTVH